jgi:hypothetical protein
MWITVSLIFFYFLAPVLLIYLTKISKFLNRLGAVVLAYLLGLIVGNIGILPAVSTEFGKLAVPEHIYQKPNFNNISIPCSLHPWTQHLIRLPEYRIFSCQL